MEVERTDNVGLMVELFTNGPHYKCRPPRFLMYTPNKNSERGGLYRPSFIQNLPNLLSGKKSHTKHVCE